MKHLPFPSNPDSDEEHRCLAEAAFESTHQSVVILDKNRRHIVTVNPAFVTTTGYTADEIKGKSFNYLMSARHNEAFFRQIWVSLKEKGQWSGEIWGRRKNGENFPALHTINPIFDNKLGRVIYYVSIFCDITVLKRQQATVDQLVYYDQLTGLPNRLLLTDRLDHALRTHARNKTQLAVLFVDLDGFKRVNDTLGHAVGDRLLQAIAERFQSLLRSGDTVARLGGDEFVILAEFCPSRSGIARIAEKIVREIARPLSIEQHAIEIQASIGVAIAPQDGSDAATLLNAADQAMYRAKLRRQGGGYSFFDES